MAEVQSRIERCDRPYHAALDAAIEGAGPAAHGAAWHLNVHSMPDDAYRRLGLPDKGLADFVLGDLDGRTAGEPVMASIQGVLREHGYSVARNDPFKGVELIARHGRPAEARHSLQIEVKRSCYADVERHEPNAGFERTQRALQAMLQALAAHVRAALAAEANCALNAAAGGCPQEPAIQRTAHERPDATPAAADFVAHRARRAPPRATAKIVSRRVEGDIHRYTYREIAARSRQLAKALAALGIEARRPRGHAGLERLPPPGAVLRRRPARAACCTRSTRACTRTRSS